MADISRDRTDGGNAGPKRSRNSAENSALAARLRARSPATSSSTRFNRGRYATDASFYQIMPPGVVVPRTMDEALRALAIRRDEGRIVTPRGGGTSQCGQTVNEGIVVDFSKAPEPRSSRSMSKTAPAWSNPASCSTTSTGS